MLTVYLTFGAWLTLPHLGAPEIFGRLCIGLCASELIAAVAWVNYRTDVWASIAGVQIPILAGVVAVFAFAYGVFVVRGW